MQVATGYSGNLWGRPVFSSLPGDIIMMIMILKTDKQSVYFQGRILIKYQSSKLQSICFFLRCKVCKYTSPDHNTIYLHVQKKHPVKLEPERHLCETCGQSFTSRTSLVRHVVQHGTSHKCKVCQMSFTDITKRDEHVLEHVETTMCERCGQNVNSHTLGVHSCV